jgi:hypothetical protein|tara:strand:+ start:250 stop:444 length:195 start_codon:yes stop_codon:yes gene_type:complete
MMWVDYTIDQVGTSFKVKGDTETEVMDKGLYTEGDVFVVKNGWLQKVGKFEELLLQHGRHKSTS